MQKMLNASVVFLDFTSTSIHEYNSTGNTVTSYENKHTITQNIKP